MALQLVDFLFALIELFVLSVVYGSRVMRRNVYSLAVYAGGRPLCTQILPGQGRPPATILGIRKMETLGYQMVKTAFFCIPSFSHNTIV